MMKSNKKWSHKTHLTTIDAHNLKVVKTEEKHGGILLNLVINT